jgi:hypothetical protein
VLPWKRLHAGVRNKLQRPLHERVLTCQKQSARRKKDKRQESAFFAARSSAFLISPSHRNLTLLFKTFKKQINVRPAMSAFASLDMCAGAAAAFSAWIKLNAIKHGALISARV